MYFLYRVYIVYQNNHYKIIRKYKKTVKFGTHLHGKTHMIHTDADTPGVKIHKLTNTVVCNI